MGDRLIVQDRQGHGHRNAVIAAQGGALRPDAAVLHQQVQALSGHVLGAAGLFFTHHIQVALKNDGCRRLIPGVASWMIMTFPAWS